MGAILYKSYLGVLAFLVCLIVLAFGQNLLSCQTTSPDASGYRCDIKEFQAPCKTFVILRTNSYFSSLSKLSLNLGISSNVIAEANGFAASTDFLPKDVPLLIPIDCKCSAGFFQAIVTKTTIRGESFQGIAESLEGLTTCKAIRENNPGVLPEKLNDRVRLLVPLRCACPSSAKVSPSTAAGILLSYPVGEGDSISKLSITFNTSAEAIVSSNKRLTSSFRAESLVPFTSLLIPINGKPTVGPLAPDAPDLRRVPVINAHKKKSKMWKIGVYVAVAAVAIGAGIAVAAAFLVIQLKKKKHQSFIKEQDSERQQLSLSVRTTSDKKVSFEGSQNTVDGTVIDNTPRKVLMETYTAQDLRKATEDFSSSNQIEGSVFLGRLNGKDLAIKRMKPETVSKIEFGLLKDPTNHHPNIIRLLGTCCREDSGSFLVFEYAENGSLKDWLHGGLAMKSQFIASCDCFLTWNQRLKICLDVAVALQFMHHIMNPAYVHRNIKSRNIFLDEDFSAKIGNFGMARCVEDDAKDSEYNTSNHSSWNPLYSAPEYIREGVVSPSIDIFAYGVILLEILSSHTPRKNLHEDAEKCNVCLPEKIQSILQSENSDELREWMDSALGDNYSFDAAVSLANLARTCIEDDPTLRPNAGEIVDRLLRMVEESPEEEHMLICESSSKPLVKAATTTGL